MAGLYLKPMAAPLVTAGQNMEGLFRQTRAIAMTNTTAHRIRPKNDHELMVEHASSCAAADWTELRHLELELPDDVTLDATDWMVCFSSRGLASDNVVVTMHHPRNGTRTLEVLLGGMLRWRS